MTYDGSLTVPARGTSAVAAFNSVSAATLFRSVPVGIHSPKSVLTGVSRGPSPGLTAGPGTVTSSTDPAGTATAIVLPSGACTWIMVPDAPAGTFTCVLQLRPGHQSTRGLREDS